jgi:chromosomal replication initiator protein
MVPFILSKVLGAPMGDEIQDILWTHVCDQFREDEGEAVFKNWIAPLIVDTIDGGVLRVLAPTAFMRDWVDSHYRDALMRLIRKENASVITLDFVVGSSHRFDAKLQTEKMMRAGAKPNKTEDTEDALSLGLDPRFTFENFVVGKTNELAYAAALRVSESKEVPFNPLFLYGGVGLGKTHLMHAIAWHIKEHHPEREVIYLSAEKFMYQFIRALRHKDTMSFKERFRSVDVLMIDDVQFISGKDSTQEEFFHTFNALIDQKKQIILSADKSPSDLSGIEERMRSRLGWGLVADIHPTTYELRLGILQAKSEKLSVVVPKDVLDFLAHKIGSNIRELEGALNRVVAHATLVGRNINIEMTTEVLRDLIRSNDRRVSIDDIQKKVAEHFDIKVADLLSSKRSIDIARPRQIAMYLSKILTTSSLPEIGRKFGGRDHTTVIHAVKKIEAMQKEDTAFAEDVDILKRVLQV